MSFRIKTSFPTKDPTNPKKSINQTDPDVIDAKYKQSKEKKQEEPVNPVLTEYKNNLVKESQQYRRQRIIYDKTTGKWRIITE